MIKKLAAAAVLAVLAAGSAKAEVIDISTIKCKDLGTMSKEEVSYVLIWLHGYFGGKAGDTTIDLAAFEENGKAIGEKCAENGELGLMTVVTQLANQ
jgi:acid stress chaperone HdeB